MCEVIREIKIDRFRLRGKRTGEIFIINDTDDTKLISFKYTDSFGNSFFTKFNIEWCMEDEKQTDWLANIVYGIIADSFERGKNSVREEIEISLRHLKRIIEIEGE